MKHILDTFLIKSVFLIIIICFLYVFRKLHILLAPKDVKNLHLKFYPIKNHVDSIHFFSRLLSIGIILSSLAINIHADFASNLLHFISWSTLSIITYFASIYILEGIILHPFEYLEEIHNKKNYTYAVISTALSLCIAFLIKATIASTGFYFLLACVTYSFIFVIFIALLKLYGVISLFKFKNYLAKDELSVALSFSGFVISVCIICIYSLENNISDYHIYLLQIGTKIIFSMLMFPLFETIIVKVFQIQHTKDQSSNVQEKYSKLGYGIFEGATFCLSSIFTSLLMPSINITSILPIFNSLPSL